MKVLLFLFSVILITTNYCQDVMQSWKDLNYANDTLTYHNLDIYLPKIKKSSYPVIISIYGSAWMANNMKGADLKVLGKPLLDAGFAVVTPNHRSSKDALFPAQIHDIKAVIRFLRANAAKYQLDTSFIGITGSSSGGNMAAMAGTTGFVKEQTTIIKAISSSLIAGNTRFVKEQTLEEVTVDIEGSLGNFTNFSSSVDAVVDWFGPTNMLLMDSCGGTDFIHNSPTSPASLYIGGPIQENKANCLLASPTTYIDKNDPPFLIFHGNKDRVVPFCQSELLYKELKNNGVQSEFYLVPEGQHGPIVQTEKYLSMMVDFFNKELKKKKD